MLSQAYGDRRGWVRSPARFSIEKLPRMNVAGEDWNIAYTDHRSRPSQTWGCYEGCLSRRMRRAG